MFPDGFDPEGVEPGSGDGGGAPDAPGAPRVTRSAKASVRVESDRGVFMISVAAELAEMHPQTLRMYEARGLIEPQRSPKGTRLYSHEDVGRLRRIQEMTAELGLNLAGVERVLELEGEVERMRRRLSAVERELERTQIRMAEEIEEVRRSFRAELIPYAGTGRELIRRADAAPTRRIRVQRPSPPT
ncbi:MAG TPA: helix-turn-helix transcriptional regulator [Solirubrobacteraceae bacterium]|jgi:MerR family transcriptional regulator/heat shock protein HspR|nr:helix-turn-helix transcriptional regulator [Solirubrobacteraceae bacterium]